MSDWLNLGQILKVNAKKFPKTIMLKDRDKAFTYPETNVRVNKLADSLLNLGLQKGDKVAVLLENCIEIVEIYLATAKTGLVIVPINFRLIGYEVEYIVNNSDARALFVHNEFSPCIDSIKQNLKQIDSGAYIVIGEKKKGYIEYEDFLSTGSEIEPEIEVSPKDPWLLIYTSGTTGTPKGVVRSHKSHIAFYLINAIDFGFTERDMCLNIMPLCHINSTFFTFTFLYIGAGTYIHPARSFVAEEILEIISSEKISFISLIPTHYRLILNESNKAKKYDIESIRKLLCSSAPVSKEMKLEIMKFFPGVELYEAYGSTEAGIVTVLKPYDQLNKLGSIGFESLGTDFVKILDDNGNEVAVGDIGELYSSGPMLFDTYYKMPDKTAASFKGKWFSAGDMAKVDKDGYFEIVDRKDNLIISGGEHVYPSEVEKVICQFPGVLDTAIVGLPHEKWGEQVTAFVIYKDPENLPSEEEIIEFCKDKMAGFKCPKTVHFISNDEMPRTGSGKILHRAIRERYSNV